MSRILLITIILVAGVGCAHRTRGRLPALVIPRECITRDVVAKGCDVSKEPPVCRQIYVDYKSGCERVVIDK